MGLFDVLGGSQHRGGASPFTLALLGVLAYRTVKGKGRLADMLGIASGTSTQSAAGGVNGLRGALSETLGNGALGRGLQDLVARFRQAGQEDKLRSWVATGPNQPIAASELEDALGEERVQWLIDQTGLEKAALLAGLSKELPDAVDKLTPDGQFLPDESQETDR